jgi:glycosyltransferase involved in cell wall biosynthesis
MLIREARLRRRVIALKQERRAHAYHAAPRVTVVIECFNKARMLPQLLERLDVPQIDEIIAIDDGSADSTLQILVEHLRKPNHFVLHANDLFEIRTYNRALRMASGAYVALIQDDDLPPAGGAWVDAALALFEHDAKLAILGGRDGLELLDPDPPPVDGDVQYRITGDIGGCPGIQKYRITHSHAIGHNRAAAQLHYQMVINRAPMWVRPTAFADIGYIDEAFAPFQCDEVDWCIRTWLAGWRVGLYPANFTSFAQGGMRLYNAGTVPAQAARNWREIYRRYGDVISSGSLQRLVDEANLAQT